jgi:hypothetical protein
VSVASSKIKTPQRGGAERPASRRRERVGGWLPFAVLAAVMGAVLVQVLALGLNSHNYLADELFNVMTGRLLANDPSTLAGGDYFIRGPERVMAIIVAFGEALFARTPPQMRYAHIVVAVAWVLAAVPAYALARGLGLERWPAVLVGALTLITPWALYGSVLLNVTLAFPLVTALAWASWRTATRPSVLGDALVLVIAAVNALTRFGQAPFAAVALLAIAYAVWLRRPQDEPILQSLVRLPLRMARTHPLLVGVATLAALTLLVVGSQIGGAAYGESSKLRFPAGEIFRRLGIWFTQLLIATGFLPALIGTAWALREAVRPRSPETGTFAVVAIGLFVVFVYTTANTYSVIEERYVAPLLALPMIAFGAALFRRDAWPLGTLLVGLLGARLLAVHGDPLQSGAFSFFLAPARLVFTQVMVPRTDLALPGTAQYVPEILGVALALVALAVAVAFARSGRAARRLPLLARHHGALAAAATVPVLVFGAVAGAYVIRSYRPATLPDKTFERMSWIERAAGGEQTLLWNHPFRGAGSARVFPALLAQYHNANGCCDLFLADLPALLAPDGALPDRFGEPRYLARFVDYHPLAFESTEVARSTEYGPDAMRVERLEAGARASLRVEGVGLDGVVAPGGAAGLEPLPAALEGPRRCADVLLGSAPDARAAVPFRARMGGRTVSGRVVPGRPPRRITLPIDGERPGRVSVPAGADGPVWLGEIAVRRCG